MASIGQVIKTQDNKRVIDIHLPFANKERLSLVGNKKKNLNDPNDNQPNFKVFGLYGEVGGVWDQVSEAGKAYKSMTLESPFGLLRFAIFELEKEEKVKNGTKTHFIVYSTPQRQDNFDNNTAQDQTQAAPGTTIPEVEFPEDEIPF